MFITYLMRTKFCVQMVSVFWWCIFLMTHFVFNIKCCNTHFIITAYNGCSIQINGAYYIVCFTIACMCLIASPAYLFFIFFLLSFLIFTFFSRTLNKFKMKTWKNTHISIYVGYSKRKNSTKNFAQISPSFRSEPNRIHATHFQVSISLPNQYRSSAHFTARMLWKPKYIPACWKGFLYDCNIRTHFYKKKEIRSVYEYGPYGWHLYNSKRFCIKNSWWSSECKSLILATYSSVQSTLRFWPMICVLFSPEWIKQ